MRLETLGVFRLHNKDHTALVDLQYYWRSLSLSLLWLLLDL
jgi:hypothetical protein